MSTISTRVLSADSSKDVLTLSVDPSDVVVSADNPKGKTGYYKLVVNSVTWEGSNLGDETISLDVRVPNFSKENDTAIVDDQSPVSDDQAIALTHDTVITAVNHGVPGPSVYGQGDGSWDLLKVKVGLKSFTDIEDFVLTVDYTLTFVEVTSFGSITNTVVNLSIDDDKDGDNLNVSLTPASGNGVYAFVPVSLATELNDNVVEEDSVPAFGVNNLPSAGGYGVNYGLVSHAISKSSVHTKNYTDSAFLFAVNNGKVDANGTIYKQLEDGSAVSRHILANVNFQRVQEWPCDDIVDAEFTFKLGFVSA